MRRDIWDDPYVDEERRQPTFGGFVLAVMVVWALLAVVVLGLAEVGVSWATLG